VQRLGQADLEGIVRFVAETGDVGGDEPFPREVLAGLRRLVPCDSVGYSELDRVRQRVLYGADEPEWDGDEPEVDYWSVRHEHPVCHYHESTGDFRALKLSDFVTVRELRARRIYTDWFRPCGVEHELCVGLDAPLWHTKVFLFDRGVGRDFDERDRAVLDLLRPWLAQRYRAAQAARRLDETLALLDRTDAAVVLVDRADHVEFATPTARALFERWFGQTGGRLPDELASWLRERRQVPLREPLTVEGGGQSLTIELVDGALLLDERRLAPRLTRREQEILDLVAEGRTNAEIAEILWVAPGTVRRHLENVFAKLGVHTRTAAAAFALPRAARSERVDPT
jgi:DNA-binding CsgD family transcriptional regulator